MLYVYCLHFLRLLKRVTLKLVGITALFLVCISAYSFSATYMVVTRKWSKVPAVTYSLVMLNSAIQPILYMAISSLFRNVFTELMSSKTKFTRMLVSKEES